MRRRVESVIWSIQRYKQKLLMNIEGTFVNESAIKTGTCSIEWSGPIYGNFIDLDLLVIVEVYFG